MNGLYKNDILIEKQFGFRSNHSTYMAIIELVDEMISAVERAESTHGISMKLMVYPLDLSKP